MNEQPTCPAAKPGLPGQLKFLLRVYLLGMVYFSLFRIVFLVSEIPQAKATPGTTLLHAWIMGWRFDTVVSGYILFLPFLLCTLLIFLSPRSVKIKLLVFWLLLVPYLLSFALCAVDIPYFKICNSRLTVTVFTWVGDTEIALNSIIKYPFFLFFLLLFIVFAGSFSYWLLRIWRAWARQDQLETDRRRLTPMQVTAVIASALTLFLGIRGRVSFKSPIRWGTAFFSNYAFANQVGLNPVFTFTTTFLENRKSKSSNWHYMDEAAAVEHVRKWLHIGTPAQAPISRNIIRDGPEKKFNIVLVIMESMSNALLGRSRLQSPSLTPFLDELVQKSYYFDRFYSSGIHTYNAIWELFSSMPSFPESKSPLKDQNGMTHFSGLATVLSEHGYQTYFACPHDDQFDNMGGFLRNNGFQNVLTPEDFPNIHLSKPWNIPDHLLFEKVLPHIRQASRSSSPFLFSILTVSNHPPYTLPSPFPSDFTPRHKQKWLLAIEYADWSIHRFMIQAQKESWFDQTIFVLVGDHGMNISPRFEINPHAHHIPLIIYAPKIIQHPQEFSQYGSQMDIFPTVMNLLNLSYVNSTLGIDLFGEARPYLILCTDTALGVMDSRFLLVVGKNSVSFLYDYTSETSANYISQKTALADNMRTFAHAVLQTARLLMDRRHSSLTSMTVSLPRN